MSSGPVTQIKIGDVIDPRTFWAHENKRLSRGAMKLRILEESLKDHISSLGSKVTIPSRPGSAVAVRHDKRWVRGKLEQVFAQQKMKKATIFLIDYGITLHDIEMADDVRRLDHQFMSEDPLAFQVVLSGLSPVSMNMDWEIGGAKTMTTSPASDWDTAALRFVKTIIEDSGAARAQAEMVDVILDKRGRRHGQVLLNNKSNKVHLNELLIEKKFAEFSQTKLDQDLLEAQTAATFSIIPIVKEEREAQMENVVEDSSSLEETVTVTDTNNNNPKRSSFMGAPPKYNRNTRTGSGKGRGKSHDNVAPLSSLVPIQSDDICKEAQGENKSNASQKLLTALRKSRGSKVVCVSNERPEEEQEDIWDQFRRTRDTRRDDTSKVHHLPGGVFVGKYHEQVVANILQGGHGGQQELRQKFEEFVIRK